MTIKLCFQGRTHKEMETISSCQDDFSYNSANSCFAIADGATQSFYPSIWAKLLVENFCINPDINQENWQKWLKPIQVKWLETVKKQVEKAKIDGNTVWIGNQNRLNRLDSATSTFIGLQFVEHKAKISIVGDSCLFIFKGHQLIQTYLLESSKDFNYRPEYFASYSKNNDYEPKFLDIELNYKQFSEKLYFVLATDALAEYIFECTEQQEDILTTLLNIYSDTEFENFVAFARHDDKIKMKNDDVTLMILEISDCEIVNFPVPIQPKQDSQEDFSIVSFASPSGDETEILTEEVKEYDSNDSEEDDSDETTEVSSGFANIRSNRQTLLQPLQSILMIGRNSRTVSSSNHQPVKQQPPVIKGIEGIRNLLLVFIPLSLLVNAITLYYAFQSFNKINNIQQEIAQNSSSKGTQQNNFKPKYINIEKGIVIYKDQSLKEILIPDVSNKSEQILVLEEGEKWIKFKIDLYAHNSSLNQCSDCGDNEIQIQPNKNLRTFPNELQEDVFGQLTKPSKFQKLKFNSLPNWHKFTFVGYVEK